MSNFSAEWERPEFDTVPSLAANAVWQLRGCDDTILRMTLRDVYRDFCKRGAALRTWRKIELEAKEECYVVAPVLSGEIDCVTQVLRYGRWPLRQGRDWSVAGDPPVLRLPFAKHIIAPDLAVEDVPPDFVMVEAVEIPHIGEERAPTSFLRRYGDAIIEGALARLMSMENRPWSDAGQAAQHAIAYQNAVSEARQRSLRSGPAANPGPRFAVDMSGAI